MSFVEQIKTHISRHDLMSRDGFYVVALSGGADSVALLCALSELGYRVEAAHCNFALRGEESRRDEQFCVSLCQQKGIVLHRVHFDTHTYAALHKVSIETAARDLRYRYFEQLRRDIGADDICVAHHRDDQVETVLLHLLRGTGLTGLQGMQPRNGHVIRPMLGVSRAEVLGYLAELGQHYVTDSTNLEDEATRNKLRLHIIPELEKINAAAKDNICRMTENLHEVARVTNDAIAHDIEAVRGDDGSYDLEGICRCVSPSMVLWTIVSPMGFNRAQMLEMLAHKHNGAQWTSARYVAVADRGRLYVTGRETWELPLPTLRIPETGVYVYPLQGRETVLAFSMEPVTDGFVPSRLPDRATLDAGKLRFPLTVRGVHDGDRMQPFGMKGTRLVNDVLADGKVPVVERRCQLVVVDSEDRIVWLVGRRIDGRFAIGHTTGTQALVIERRG